MHPSPSTTCNGWHERRPRAYPHPLSLPPPLPLPWVSNPLVVPLKALLLGTLPPSNLDPVPETSARISLCAWCAGCVWGTGCTKRKLLFWMRRCVLIPSGHLPPASGRQPPASSIFSQPLTFVDVLSCLLSSSRTLLILAPLRLLSPHPPPYSLFFADLSAVRSLSRRHSSSSLPFSLHPITFHFRSFPCWSVRSPLLFSTLFILFLILFPSPHILPFSHFSLRIRPQSAPPPMPFILFLTVTGTGYWFKILSIIWYSVCFMFGFEYHLILSMFNVWFRVSFDTWYVLCNISRLPIRSLYSYCLQDSG